MYAIRHKPTNKWMTIGNVGNFGDTPKVFTTLGGIKSAVDAYVSHNSWRCGYEQITIEDIYNELEVCKIEVSVIAAIPGTELTALFGM